MTRRPLALALAFTALLLLGAPACGGGAPSEPDALAREVFALLQADDFGGFSKLALTQGDYDSLMARATFPSDDKRARVAERGQAAVVKAARNARKGWDKVRAKAAKLGVVWGDATYVRAEPKLRTKDGVEGGDIMLVFAFHSAEFEIKLDDCIKADRGWVLVDNMSLRSPSAPEEVRVEQAPSPPAEAPTDAPPAPAVPGGVAP